MTWNIFSLVTSGHVTRKLGYNWICCYRNLIWCKAWVSAGSYDAKIVSICWIFGIREIFWTFDFFETFCDFAPYKTELAVFNLFESKNLFSGLFTDMFTCCSNFIFKPFFSVKYNFCPDFCLAQRWFFRK